MTLLDTFTNLFIPTAHADTAVPVAAAGAAQPQQAGGFPLIMMLAVFVLFMYFFVWRPQGKRAKEQRNLLNSLTKGDEVMTSGGILGKITKINDNYAVLALADNVEITIQKSSIVNALPKGTLKSI